MPKVVDPKVTRSRPELGVISPIFHKNNEHVALAALEGVLGLLSVDQQQAMRYDDILQDAITGATLARVENKMRQQRYQYVSEFARKHIAEGRAEGRADGRAEEAARAVIVVFEAREMAVSDDVRTRIEECDDLETLERWLKRAISAELPADIFTE